jgi:hypothetical protein
VQRRTVIDKRSRVGAVSVIYGFSKIIEDWSWGVFDYS